jgi:cytochrome c2
VACHADDGIAKKVGPNLLDVGWRVDSLFLKEFIVNPAGMDPGTQMPNLLEHLPEA